MLAFQRHPAAQLSPHNSEKSGGTDRGRGTASAGRTLEERRFEPARLKSVVTKRSTWWKIRAVTNSFDRADIVPFSV
jgi:hypothetical protein